MVWDEWALQRRCGAGPRNGILCAFGIASGVRIGTGGDGHHLRVKLPVDEQNIAVGQRLPSGAFRGGFAGHDHGVAENRRGPGFGWSFFTDTAPLHKGHRCTPAEREHRTAVGQHEVEGRGGLAGEGTGLVDKRDRCAKGFQEMPFVNVVGVEGAFGIEVAQKNVKEHLAVGLPSNVSFQEVGQCREKGRLERFEARNGPLVGEKPGAHPEGVGVLRSKVAHGGLAQVHEHAVGDDVPAELVPIGIFGASGALAVEDFAALVETEAPTGGGGFSRRRCRREGGVFVFQDLREAVRAIGHVTEESCHLVLVVLGRSERRCMRHACTVPGAVDRVSLWKSAG